MRNDQSDTEHVGFAETPSKDEWLGLLSELSADLVAIELRAAEMRDRIELISRRLFK